VSRTVQTLESILNITLRDIFKHLIARYPNLFFVDRHFEELGWFVDTRNPPQTDLEQYASFEAEQLEITLYGCIRERHLVFELSHTLMQEKTARLHEQKRKFFDWNCKMGLNTEL
jgi:hypothetical protein